MSRLKVKKSRTTIKVLDEVDKRIKLEFDRLRGMASQAIKEIVANSQPAYQRSTAEQETIETLRKSILRQREEAKIRSAKRRRLHGAPTGLEEKGMVYRVESHLEPVAQLARSLSEEDFRATFQPRTEEEAQAERVALEKDDRRASLWLKVDAKMKRGELPHLKRVEDDTQYQMAATDAAAAARHRVRVSRKWDGRRGALHEARLKAEKYAAEDGVQLLLPDARAFWQNANLGKKG